MLSIRLPGHPSGAAVCGLLLLAVVPATSRAAEPPDVTPEMQQIRRARWMASTDQLLVAPYYSIKGDSRASLLLMNRFGEPIDYEARAISLAGRSFPLGEDEIPSRGVVEIDLREFLTLAPGDFEEGSLEVSYFGDPEMAQAWVVLSGERGSLEIPLAKVETVADPTSVSFWDLSPFPRGRKVTPRFALHNSGSTPATVTFSWSSPAARIHVARRGLAPGQTAILERPQRMKDFASGRIHVTHDGEAGQVSMNGFLAEGETLVGVLPVTTPTELASQRAIEGLGIPDVPGSRAVVTIADLRPEGSSRQVRVELVGREDGLPRAFTTLTFEPGEIETVDLSTLVPEAGGGDVGDFRPSISSDEPGLAASAFDLMPDGTVIDLALTERGKIHDTGTYLIPSLESHEVTTTFVNLGEEPAELFGHFTSDRGEYALDPILVPAGGTYVLDFRSLSKTSPTDRLGRRLERGFDWGFFQWLSRRGSTELLARTEVRRPDEMDRIGFNCYGCCNEMPTGAVIPESIGFDVGQAPLFEAIEYVDTCAGMTGPYHAYPDVMYYSAPLSWNGWNISTSGLTSQDVLFQGSGEYMAVTCVSRTRTFFGGGDVTVDKCMRDHGPPDFDESQSCAVQSSSCSNCYDCCEKIKQVAYCRCDKLLMGRTACRAEARYACGVCKQTCFGTFLSSCSQQLTSCPS